MNLNDLKKEITFKWRVQSYSKTKAQASCVAYIDARQVMDLLDEVVGPERWQDKYYEVKGNLFCSIGIRVKGIWIWKTDCGTESNVDKQKGEASDAFKRAAVKHGIGRFLYSKRLVYLKADKKKEGNNYPNVVDDNGKQIPPWDLTDHINNKYGNTPPPAEYETAQQAAQSLENIMDLEDFENACKIYQADHKAKKTGWTTPQWNILTKTMAEIHTVLSK